MNATVVRQLLGKLGGLLLTLFLSSVVIFSAVLLTPGDPVMALAGGLRPTPDLIAAIREQHNLDDPVWQQYLQWIGSVLSAISAVIRLQDAVVDLIGPRIGDHSLLVLYTVVLIAIFGVGSGILAATRGPRADRAVLISTVDRSRDADLRRGDPAHLRLRPRARLVPGLRRRRGPARQPVPPDAARDIAGRAVHRLHQPHHPRRGGRAAALRARRHRPCARHPARSDLPRTTCSSTPRRRSSPISGATVAGLFAVSAIAEQAFGLGGLGSLLTEAAARKDLPVVQVISLMLFVIFVVLQRGRRHRDRPDRPRHRQAEEDRMSVAQLAGGRIPLRASRRGARSAVIAAGIVLLGMP